MKTVIRFRPAAADDFEAIVDYIREERPSAARGFALATRDTIRLLAQTPGMGRSARFARSKNKDVRQFPVIHYQNYVVFFRPIEAGIEVLRIPDGRRDYSKLV